VSGKDPAEDLTEAICHTRTTFRHSLTDRRYPDS